MTHRETEPCPFAKDHFPTGPMATCCSLRGKSAANNLKALHEDPIAAEMYTDMTAARALVFATMLRRSADDLETKYAGHDPKPEGFSYGGSIEITTGAFTPWPRPSFEEALASIREAARWYDKVGRMGFDVHAWS